MKIVELHLYQILVTIVAASMIAHGFSRYFKKETGQTFLKLGLRVMVWGGAMAITLFPFLTNKVARFIGIEGNINAVILTGFLLIFLIIFKLISSLERLEGRIAVLARKDALLKIRRKRKRQEF
ncbi:MAG: DUF2304 domain-containing protein [Patescibacteria group bacterium]